MKIKIYKLIYRKIGTCLTIKNQTTINKNLRNKKRFKKYQIKAKKLKSKQKQDNLLNREGINRTVIIDAKTRGDKKKKVNKELKKLI